MRHNAVKEKVLGGEPAIGAYIAFPSPELVEFCGFLGFEWIFIDAEHGPIGWSECQAMCRACDALGLSSVVRVPKLDHALIMTYLQTGPLGIAVPHINTAEEAEAVVQAARYYPEGRRGCDLDARSSGYNLIEPAQDYFAHSNRELLVAVWVEETEGMRNLDEILQVPGIDAVNFGPCDLALSMGFPGRWDHQEVQAAMAEGRKKVLDAGKVLIAEPADVQSARQALAEGALLISTEVGKIWAKSAGNYLRELRGS